MKKKPNTVNPNTKQNKETNIASNNATTIEHHKIQSKIKQLPINNSLQTQEQNTSNKATSIQHFTPKTQTNQQQPKGTNNNKSTNKLRIKPTFNLSTSFKTDK